MGAAGQSDDLHNTARKFVQHWEKEFLKPDPETYICHRLDLTAAGRMPQWGEYDSQEVRDMFRRALRSEQLKRALQQAGTVLVDEVNQLLRDSVPTPTFEQFLEELALTERAELNRIAARFHAHGITLEISRDAVDVKYQDLTRCTWQVLCQNGNISVVTWSRVNELRPVGISRLGAIARSTRDSVLWDLHAFLAQVADNFIWWTEK